VHERVGSQRDEFLDRVGGADTGGLGEAGLGEAADLGGVLADLVGVGDADADQLERRVPDDLRDDQLADDAGAPDDDPIHRSNASLTCASLSP